MICLVSEEVSSHSLKAIIWWGWWELSSHQLVFFPRLCCDLPTIWPLSETAKDIFCKCQRTTGGEYKSSFSCPSTNVQKAYSRGMLYFASWELCINQTLLQISNQSNTLFKAETVSIPDGQENSSATMIKESFKSFVKKKVQKREDLLLFSGLYDLKLNIFKFGSLCCGPA